MLSCMEDSAHDKEHVYRVLFNALDIAETESGVNYDILISACLLHDVGRKEQFQNPELCHAEVGSVKACRFLMELGCGEKFAISVRDCILTHRFRKNRPPQSLEAKILFDADKLDVTGAIGIARTLMYKADTAAPIYTLLPDGSISDGTQDASASFFREYKVKLEKLYDRFYTKRGSELANVRQEIAVSYYRELLAEVSSSYQEGKKMLGALLKENGDAG